MGYRPKGLAKDTGIWGKNHDDMPFPEFWKGSKFFTTLWLSQLQQYQNLWEIKGINLKQIHGHFIILQKKKNYSNILPEASVPAQGNRQNF